MHNIVTGLLYMVVFVCWSSTAAPLEENFEAIGRTFGQQFYHIFDGLDAESRSATLKHFYDAEESFLTFEGQSVKGQAAIEDKLKSLAFTKIEHRVTALKSQPISGGAVLVSVTGKMKTDDDPVTGFSDVFILQKTSDDGFKITNEVFQLIINEE